MERITEIYLINYFPSIFTEFFYTIVIVVVTVTRCYFCSSFLTKTQNFRKNRNSHSSSSPRVALVCVCIVLRQRSGKVK